MEMNFLFTDFNQFFFRQEQAFSNHRKQFYLQPFYTLNFIKEDLKILMIDEQNKSWFSRFKEIFKESVNYKEEIFMKKDDGGKNYFEKNEICEFLVSTLI